MTSLFVILLVLAAGAALVAQLVRWLSGRPERERVPPPLIYPLSSQFDRRPAVTAAESVQPPLTSAVAAATVTSASVTPAATTPTTVTTHVVAEPIKPVEPDPASSETVQFLRPGDEALQLLPARFEVVSGISPPQVIRFVRVPGQAPEMIIGREAASSPQQVTLTSSTVSRRHARVSYSDGRWLVTNLSHTNPVVVNDHALAEFEGPRPLIDGDRIELGDVVLRFCTS